MIAHYGPSYLPAFCVSHTHTHTRAHALHVRTQTNHLLMHNRVCARIKTRKYILSNACIFFARKHKHIHLRMHIRIDNVMERNITSRLRGGYQKMKNTVARKKHAFHLEIAYCNHEK